MSEVARILKMTNDPNYMGYSFCSEAEQMALKAQSLQAQLTSERELSEALREALENIIKHQDLILGDAAMFSVTRKIAQQALAKYNAHKGE